MEAIVALTLRIGFLNLGGASNTNMMQHMHKNQCHRENLFTLNREGPAQRAKASGLDSDLTSSESSLAFIMSRIQLTLVARALATSIKRKDLETIGITVL